MLLVFFFIYFVNLIKKSLTICLRQDRKKHFDFLRGTAGGIRHPGASGADGI